MAAAETQPPSLSISLAGELMLNRLRLEAECGRQEWTKADLFTNMVIIHGPNNEMIGFMKERA